MWTPVSELGSPSSGSRLTWSLSPRPEPDRRAWALRRARRPRRALSVERADCGDEILFGGELAEPGQALDGSLDVRPPHDPVAVHEELAFELRELSLEVLAVGVGLREAVKLVERLGRLGDGQWLGQLAGRIDPCVVHR